MPTRGWPPSWRSGRRFGRISSRDAAAIEAEFETKIVALGGNWCAYVGADLAGTSHIRYPRNVRIVYLMCSGTIDPVRVVKPLLDGADGVLR
jgi:F420-non-reducing hydrogenase iron-sulfur subunit